MDLTRFLLVAGILVWLLYEGNLKTGYNWQWYRIPSFFGRFTGGNFIPGPLILGTMVTIKVSLAGMLLSSILGLATALARFSPFISLRCLALGYMELIRNTPLLVQIFFIYFVIFFSNREVLLCIGWRFAHRDNGRDTGIPGSPYNLAAIGIEDRITDVSVDIGERLLRQVDYSALQSPTLFPAGSRKRA